MNPARRFSRLTVASAVIMLVAGGCASGPRSPEALPVVGDTFGASYDVVWDATLKSLGVLRLRVADKGTGRIETEPFTFTFSTGAGGQGGATQVLWIALQITVLRSTADKTDVRVEPIVHDALLSGFLPGPTNNPWTDLFGKIRGQLGSRP